jgi:HSP20 family protein
MGLFSRRNHDDQQSNTLLEDAPQETNFSEFQVPDTDQEVNVETQTEINHEVQPMESHDEPMADAQPNNQADEQANESPQQDWLDDYEGQLTIDVYQTDEEIIVKSTIAGVGSANLDVTLNGDMLTIKGERKRDQTVRDEDYFYQECYWGAFSRSVILPMDVEEDKIKASLKDGILTVRLPKAHKEKTRKIDVSIEG